MVSGLFGLAIILVIGAGWLALILDEPGRWRPSARLGLSFGLGLIVMTLALFFASLGGLLPSFSIGVLLALFSVSAAVLRRGRRFREVLVWGDADLLRDSSRDGGLAGYAGGLIIVAAITLVAAVSMLEPIVEWDVVATWTYKARVLMREPIGETQYFHDVTKAFSNLDYPLLWPLSIAWIWTCAGEGDPQMAKILSPALLAAFAFVLLGILERVAGRARSLVITAIFITLPMMLSQAIRLMADAPLGFYIMASAGMTWLWLRDGRSDDLKLAGAFAVGMLFTKNEGAGHLLILLLVTLAATIQDRRKDVPAVLLWLLVVPALATACWFQFRSGIPQVKIDYAGRLRFSVVGENLFRLPAITIGAMTSLLNWRDWHIFWPIVFVTYTSKWRGIMMESRWFPAVAILLASGIYAVILAVTPWTVEDLLEFTAPRLFLQVAPLGAFMLAAGLAPDPPLESRTWPAVSAL